MLTLMILVPVAGGVLAWVASRRSPRAGGAVALGTTLLLLVLAGSWWRSWPELGSVLAPLHEENVPWIAPLGIRYHLLLDGLSLVLVSGTALLGVVAVVAALGEVRQQPGLFWLVLLTLLGSIVGVYLAADLVLFYLFWELMLLPLYLLVRFWGRGPRAATATKLFLYTFTGGLLLLAALLGLAVLHREQTGVATFDLVQLLAAPSPSPLSALLLLGFFLGFAVKMPAVPLHGWLPDADTYAPLPAVILGTAMLETGAYGLLRFALPLLPEAFTQLAPLGRALGVAGILYGGLLAFRQQDLRRVAAYLGLSQTGYILLGLFAGTPLALGGAVLGMAAHLLGLGGLFFLAEVLRRRCGTTELAQLGDLWRPAPRLGGFTLIFALAAMGLPGLASFAAELLVLLGTYPLDPPLAALAALGALVSVIYALRLVHAAVLLPAARERTVVDLRVPELIVLGMLAAGLLGLGLQPKGVLVAARPTLAVVQEALQGARNSPARASSTDREPE